jgi:hypothetical protein
VQLLPLVGQAHVLFMDPPYGIALENHDSKRTRNAGATRRSYAITGDDTREPALAALRWADARDLVVVTFASPWAPWPGEWRNLVVWDKGGAAGGGGDTATCLKRTWELVQVARNGPLGEGRQESVVRFPLVPGDTGRHVAAKPVGLLEWLLVTFTRRGDVVVDPFMGRGPLGVACANTGRRFIGMEIDPQHFAAACRTVGQAYARALEKEAGRDHPHAPEKPHAKAKAPRG